MGPSVIQELYATSNAPFAEGRFDERLTKTLVLRAARTTTR